MAQFTEYWQNGELISIGTETGSIPADPNNMEYLAYLEWKADGGEPEVVVDRMLPAPPGQGD